jgi:hypothetical protein
MIFKDDFDKQTNNMADALKAGSQFTIELLKQDGISSANKVLLALRRELGASGYTEKDATKALGITTEELKERLLDVSKMDIKTAFILSEMLKTYGGCNILSFADPEKRDQEKKQSTDESEGGFFRKAYLVLAYAWVRLRMLVTGRSW